MADNSLIEWTDATWNPVTGCSVVSPGCTNCYAMKLAGTRLQHHPSRKGLTVETKAGPVWNGQVRLNEEWLAQPLQWKRPRRIFVCAHGDLFAENVPDEWIDRVFAIMALAPQHTFQILTKRAARMRAYMTDRAGLLARHMIDEYLIKAPDAALGGRSIHARWPVVSIGNVDHPDDVTMSPWPLPNVHMGVSVEDQPRADERVRELLRTPAAVRWISAEPLIGPVDFCAAGMKLNGKLDVETGERRVIDWIVVGGESGHGARPMHPDWARQIRDDAAACGVPFFFKQWGAWTPGENVRRMTGVVAGAWLFDGRWDFDDVDLSRTDETVDDEPNLYCVGKSNAGRLLDGVEHNAQPEART